MKYKGLMIPLLAATLLLPSAVYAHRVEGKVETGAIVVTAHYDTGEPMSYAKVKILAPGETVIFQSGRTDRNGRFCFFPDTGGDWKVVVDDELGHRLEIIVPVSESMGLKSDQKKGQSITSFLSRYERALTGICIIFGIAAVLFWWKGRRMSKRG